MKLDTRPDPAPSAGQGKAQARAVLRELGAAQQFWLPLTEGQVQEVVQQEAENREAGRGLLGVLLALNGIGEQMGPEQVSRDEGAHDRKISQTVIHSLLVLGPFASGEPYALNDLSKTLSMANSTVWRYLKTWVAVGALEERRDRRYQLAVRWRRELPKKTQRGVAARAK